MCTALYERNISYDYGSDETNALMKKVWEGTPWVVNVFTDTINSERERGIREWCRDQFGRDAWPIHGKPGDWYVGSATVNGWTHIGFKTEEMMNRFMAAWPNPESQPDHRQ